MKRFLVALLDFLSMRVPKDGPPAGLGGII